MHNGKYCVKCKTIINISAKPYIIKNGRGYYFCKSCGNSRMKNYYQKVKMVVFKHYGNKCICCGETNLLFLTIDHINNDGNVHRWPGGKRINGIMLYSKIKTANFPKTYQILCMNCNFGKRMNGGVCPHTTTVV